MITFRRDGAFHARPADPQEPAWIRDITACPKGSAQIAFLFGDEKKVPELCAGERYFCEFCGAGFPLWPISEWASHVLQTHANDLTLQQTQGILQLCSEGLTDHTKQFLSLQLMSRVILRRRAHELKMLVLLDARGQVIENAGAGFTPSSVQ